MAIKIRSKK